MSTSDVEVVRRAWAAVPHGDADEFRDLLAPEVRWYGAGEAEGGCQNRDEALAFIKQARNDGVTAEAMDIRDAGARVVAIVQTRHPDEWGDQPVPHGEVITVRDGKIAEMIVYPDVDSALAAVRQGGGPSVEASQ